MGKRENTGVRAQEHNDEGCTDIIDTLDITTTRMTNGPNIEQSLQTLSPFAVSWMSAYVLDLFFVE